MRFEKRDERKFKEDVVLRALSYRGIKASTEFIEDDAGLRMAQAGSSVREGNLKFGYKVENDETAYFIKGESGGTPDYLNSYVSSVLSYMQDSFSNDPAYHPVPKEKIVVEGHWGERVPAGIASESVDVDAHIRYHSTDFDYSFGDNFLLFFTDPALDLSHKLQMADICARMLVFHEFDTNTNNFLIDLQNNMRKIDNVRTSFGKYVIEPIDGLNELHYVLFLNTIINNESGKSVYTPAFSDWNQLKLNKDFFGDLDMDYIKQDPIRCAYLATFTQRALNYIQMPREIRRYVFSKEIFGREFESFSPETQKQIASHLDKKKAEFAKHLTDIEKFLKKPIEQLGKLIRISQGYEIEIPAKPCDYDTALQAIKEAKRLGVNLHEFKKTIQALPQNYSKEEKQKLANAIRQKMLKKAVGRLEFQDSFGQNMGK